MKVKLPKQWKHWLYRLGLRPHGKRWKHRQVLYYKGRGRVWRVALDHETGRNYFQGGDRYENFDRWAISNRYDFSLPLTFEQFSFAVDSLKDAP